MKFNKDLFRDNISRARRIGIAGHIKPDGDCVGACIGLYNYIRDNYSTEADIFLESVPGVFAFLSGSGDIITDYDEREAYDVFIALDSSDRERIGAAIKYFDKAEYSYVIDHHITNQGYGDENLIIPEASAACEVLFGIFEEDKISQATAEALYLGIVHDTGVFKHSNTTRHTMEVAGLLIDKGADPSMIIDRTFYEKTYLQNQILGRCLMESMLLMNGRVIMSSVSAKVQQFYGITPADMEGIIDQLRVTKGIEVAMLLKEMGNREWKVSMRSNHIVDVGRICARLNGGGHIRAAGCTMHGELHDVVNSLTRYIEEQLIDSED